MVKIDEIDMNVFREIARQLTKMNERLMQLDTSVEALTEEVRTYVTSQTLGKTKGINTL